MAQKTSKAREAYVDTSALIAFLDRSDSHHPLFRRLFSSPPPLITSALVVAEGHGWFLRRYDQQRGIQFLSFLEEFPAMHLQPFDAGEFAKTSYMVRKFADQRLTLPDAHGLVIMQERRISVRWSTDRHLALTGVRLVV